MAEQRDDLTQLLTRGAFDADLQTEVAAALRQNQPLSLVFGDIDHFKRVNDTHGHQVGDAVLREVAARLVSVVERKGCVYRYGGEEVAAILRNHSAEEALAVAERCRRQIEKDSVAGVSVSMSFGVACVPDHATDARALVGAADRALYDAKERGRNLVRLFGEPAPLRAGPREPDRKAPEPGRLTDQQKAQFRRNLLRHLAIECPQDGAFFEVHDITGMSDRGGRDFMIVCPECGLTETLPSGQGVV